LLLIAGAFIKGPIVHAFLLPGLLAYEIWRRRTGAASGWLGGWPWICSLIPLAVWAYVGVRFVPGFQDQVVLREFFGRFSESVHTPQPFYFYLPHLLQKFAPWSLLLLMLAWLYWHREPNETRDKRPDAGLIWLACWFVGGLVVMSMIPSKRVDRIFPLIPPLCLLVASLVGPVLHGRKPILAHRLAVASVFVAIALTTIYSVARIAVARRDHADALVEFGKTVRQWAAQADWRYAAVYGGDEGMLLYLDRLSFTEKDMLISEWNLGKLDAAIVPARDAQIYVDALQPRPVTFLRSRSRGEDKPDYVLLERKE
jgi:4-amino-4-deoxy-L-arabinose transferase-like glycosyltransferase